MKVPEIIKAKSKIAFKAGQPVYMDGKGFIHPRKNKIRIRIGTAITSSDDKGNLLIGK